MAVTCNVSEALYEPCLRILHQMLQDLGPDKREEKTWKRLRKRKRKTGRIMRAPLYAQKSVRNLLTEARTSFKRSFPPSCQRAEIIFGSLLPPRENDGTSLSLATPVIPQELGLSVFHSPGICHIIVQVTRECRTLENNTSYNGDDYRVSKTIVVSEERIKGAKLSPSKAHLG